MKATKSVIAALVLIPLFSMGVVADDNGTAAKQPLDLKVQNDKATAEKTRQETEVMLLRIMAIKPSNRCSPWPECTAVYASDAI
jgi:hypothetical protein